MKYTEFLHAKSQLAGDYGFEPTYMPADAFPFQRDLITWAVRKGRGALFADCGMGKTLMQLAWAENVARHADGRVLIITPLAVSHQTVAEAHKFGLEAERSEAGKLTERIVVTNYERLHYFKPDDFVGVVCDESSILKHFTGATQQAVTRFMCKTKFRNLCTATAAPNDYVELGTSSECLGELGHSDMLTMFFRQLDDKGQKSETKKQDFAESLADSAPQHYQRLAYRVSQTIGQWRLKNHAVQEFWRWVASWARACRFPSDLGYSDEGFRLPKLIETDHVVTTSKPPEGMLFTMPAFGRQEELAERRRSTDERCQLAAKLVAHDKPAVIWCHLNDEGDMLEKMIPDSVQVSGSMEDDEKIEAYNGFASGKIRVLVIKPKIGAWGLNWQHCAHVVSFASHSYEQYYQSVRRCWRFGQKNDVRLDVIASEGESRVIANMRRKADQAALMFAELVKHMDNSHKIQSVNKHTKAMEIPSWL